MTLRARALVALGLSCAFALLSAMAYGFERGNRGVWEIYRNERFGFQIAYPTALLEPDGSVESSAGRLFRSRDGRVTLLAGAGLNEAGDSIATYRDFLLAESYQSARLDYAPVRSTWFVLSGLQAGTSGDEMFYERVTFTCSGRMIYGWRLTYPAAERAVYDRIVEGIHRGYRPGQGENGAC